MLKLVCVPLLGLAVLGGAALFSAAQENRVSVQDVTLVQDEYMAVTRPGPGGQHCIHKVTKDWVDRKCYRIQK